MMTNIPRAHAQAMALRMASRLIDGQLAHRAQVAGSLRRHTERVNDIDIVVAPIWHRTQVGLFADMTEDEPTGLDQWIASLMAEHPTRILWDRKADGTPRKAKDLRALLVDSVKLELWLCKPDQSNWGALLQMRTGSALFNQALATRAQMMGLRYKAGYGIFKGEERVDDDTEAGIFTALGLPARIPPRRRHEPALIAALKAGHLNVDWLNTHNPEVIHA